MDPKPRPAPPAVPPPPPKQRGLAAGAPPTPPPPSPPPPAVSDRGSLPDTAPPPPPDGTTAVPAEQSFSIEELDIKATLCKFYERHAPEKLDRIDFVLSQYVNEEEQMLADLAARYQLSEADMLTFCVPRLLGAGAPPPKPTKPKPAKEISPANPVSHHDHHADHADDDDDEEEGDGEAERAARASVCTIPPIRIGNLTKVRIKDGALQPLLFVLKGDGLFYVKKQRLDGMRKFFNRLTGFDFGTKSMIERNTRNIDILKLMASELGPDDTELLQRTASMLDVNLDCVFILRSKRKSFYVIAPTSAERQGWYSDIEEIRKAAQLQAAGGQPPLNESQMCPLYTFKSEVSDCSQCGRSFGLFSRRHHCRQCGVVVCEVCSRNKVRIPRLDERMLFKCCNACTAQLKAERRYGAASVI